MTVMLKVLEGVRPSRPVSCSGTAVLDSLWDLMQNCWAGKAEMRPAVSEIVERLGSLSWNVMEVLTINNPSIENRLSLVR
jgi:hypothetical protein